MSKKEKVKAGLIGVGGIAQVSHIPNLTAVDDVELVAVSDTDVGRAISVSERYGISNWFEDPEQMFKACDLDCVLITTPTISHLPLCQLAFESKVDVMIEKPFARNTDEAQRIVQLAEDNDRILMVGMNHRFREDSAHLKEMLDNGSFGDIITISAGWLKRLGVWGRPYWFTDPKLAGGGVLMDLGLQLIDVALFMLDFPTVVEANCGISNKLLGLEVEDSASVFLKFDNETTFLMDVSWGNCDTQDVAYTYFSGSQGSVSLNPLRINRRSKDRVMPESSPVMADAVELYRRSFQSEIIHFIDCVTDRSEPLSTGREALAVIEIIEKLYKNAGD